MILLGRSRRPGSWVCEQVRTKSTGDMVEGFRVLSELGRGAASAIYLVQHPRSKQVWALKHIAKDAPKDQRFLDQAESEYRVATRLDHPAIRRIQRLIKKKQHLISVRELFLVMELVDGMTLEAMRRPQQVDAVHIFHQVAEGLAHMHEHGYVHADMKPNNIIVSDNMVVKIIDLGQSCAIGTIKPRIQGTPDYIAPEQVHRRAITPRTDVYNLGATMYWVMTGRNIPTALAKEDSLVGSLETHLIERAKPVVEMNSDVNHRLNDLIMQCVEPNPEQRPRDMHQVADRLNLILGILRAKAERSTSDGAPAV